MFKTPPTGRLVLTVSALALLSACQTETNTGATAAGPAPDASNPPASTDLVLTSPDSTDYTQPVQLLSMQNGDIACYLNVKPDGEPERTDMADFGFCEREDLIGQRVVLTVTPNPVLAESCQGDPDCPDTEVVNLVTGIDLAGDGPAADAPADSAASE
ncbi:MAG TPA: hypothetical protein VGB53_06660 [Rubricoccaceae bacterium]|jgi:hypothetical protein